MTATDGRFFVGVDAGTASVRAGVFESGGRLLGAADSAIEVWRPQDDFVEQSSRDIWRAVGEAVRRAVAEAAVDARAVEGIGFDATCSLVALDRNSRPLTVSPGDNPDHNIIVWMDHRATDQADRINATGHAVLRYVGGRLSPEQEPPKLLWLKENLPQTWSGSGKFLDLADYLVYQACGDDVRSQCTVVCKWTYLGHEGAGGSWDRSFFRRIDLDDLFEGDRAGRLVAPVGSGAGALTAEAAAHLGLVAGTAVATGIIDAHAGGLGVLGMRRGDEDALGDMDAKLALISGTSSCHMAVSREARFIPGVWGPYYGAMIPDMWLNEGGQSVTGALIDHVIESHVAYPALKEAAAQSGRTIYQALNDELAAIGPIAVRDALAGLHVLPYFHGNRSPRADSRARGMISGLTIDSSLRSLALLYLATIQAIAHGTRHIVEAMNAAGYRIRQLHACGGGAKNPVLMQEHADITGCRVLFAPNMEPVLLGSAMLAAVAAGAYRSVADAMRGMSPTADVVKLDVSRRGFHEAKYRVFKRMYEHQLEYREMLEEAQR